ncbi:hypothetical protein [Lysinibacillus sp. Bpr_S20]|uniref:hypothetical protein n=1 Tax=Lysinibacillus sp. Bpr_S20 TaxID=2933964 RepID=UPI0020122D2F|nr:hypothetical protein [Lysinibacillus sp. Bpr_S20]
MEKELFFHTCLIFDGVIFFDRNCNCSEKRDNIPINQDIPIKMNSSPYHGGEFRSGWALCRYRFAFAQIKHLIKNM